MARRISVFAAIHKESTMKPFLVALSSVLALLIAHPGVAQTTVRVRGIISEAKADALRVESRDGRDITLHLAPGTQVSIAKAIGLADIPPGAYLGVTSVRGPDGRLVAKEVHTLPPQAPSGHMPWDLLPGSSMTNANLASTTRASGGNEITLTYKGGERKILVTPETAVVTFVPGSRADLRAGESIFAIAQVDGQGRFATQRVSVSKDGVKPPQ
jgi:hypothetical protein